jgi:flavin-dependent dehydrogenase
MQPDVAIIGGGPSGCAAALALLSRGHSVVVIAAPAHKEKPTETAAPALAHLLRSLGAKDALSACEPCHGIESAWGRTVPAFQPSIMNPSGHAWFIHRSRFDSCLRSATTDSGAAWMIDKARSVSFLPDSVSIVTTGQTVRARWTILATGSPESAARLTGQKVNRMDSMVAFWARLPTPFEQRLLLVEPAEQGWWYLCPADGPGAIACFVTDPASARALRPSDPTVWNALFRSTRISRQTGGRPSMEHVHGALTGLAALPRIIGKHWIAAGDAAAKLDPLGSSGTMTALDSGRRAAYAIAAALRGDSAGLELYSKWYIGLVEEFALQRLQQYEYETRWQANEFWSRRILAVA